MKSICSRIFVIVIFASCAHEGHSADIEGSDPHELSEYVLSTIDTVVEKHIDPPTRQSLALGFCQSVSPNKRKPLGLGRAISLADHAELIGIVEEQIAEIDDKDRRNVVENALSNTLRSRAQTTITKRSEHRVNEQIAANRYVGIGIALGKDRERPIMMQVIEDGPAHLGGAKKGDVILRVDGVETHDKDLREVVDMLRGPADSKVEIVLAKSGGPERTLTLTRGVVPFKHVENFRVIKPGIAAVTVKSITGSIVRDLRRLTPKILENDIKGIVLEIGSNNAAYRPALMFANALIDGKPIGGLETNNGTQKIVADPGELWPGVAIAVSCPLPVQDALAWVLHSMSHQQRIFVDHSVTMGPTMLTPHAWKYEPIDLPGGDRVAVMPTGRLLIIEDSSDEGNDGYASLSHSYGLTDPVNRIEAAMIRQTRSAALTNPNASSVDRAAAALLKQIETAK